MSVADALPQDRAGVNLPGYALFGGMLAMAGLPIYIHAPKFYGDTYGVSLAAIGAVLLVLRLLDMGQDPFFGWLSTRFASARSVLVAAGGGLMALSMLGLFAVTPPIAPIAWFALTLTGLFSGYSLLVINFYAQGVQTGAGMGQGGHVRLASWRETGTLLGVCIAAAMPTVLMSVTDQPFAGFAAVFAAICLLSVFVMRGAWQGAPDTSHPVGFRAILSDGLARRLLLIALLNALPVAVSSTLFLYFVELRLGALGWEGALLILFFLAAAASAPAWGWLARRIGTKSALLIAMVLAIVAFAYAGFLVEGQIIAFAVICLASGAAMGADLTLLPAIFSRHMAEIAPEAGQGFGLWSFVNKLTLAVAAVAVLPALDAAGLQADGGPDATALWLLSVFYALVPCALKLFAIALLATTDLKER